MKLKLWGVRGSLPAPVTPESSRRRLEEALLQYERMRQSNIDLTAKAFIETLPPHLAGGYGGNTSCGEVSHNSTRLLIDAGSGLRAFSDFVSQSEPDTKEFHLYFTHFHWDHLIGLPFFAPIYAKGKTIHCYAVHDDLERSLEILFTKPNFPVPYQVVKKQLRLHKLEPRKPVQIGDLSLTPFALDHPDPCWGARIEGGGKSVAWAVDTECTRVSRDDLGPDLPLYTDADLLIFDAQYSFDEALEKINWGHSSGPVGLDLALRERVKRALFVHHDPTATDEAVRAAEEQTQLYFDALLKAREHSRVPGPELIWRFGREGDCIEL